MKFSKVTLFNIMAIVLFWLIPHLGVSQTWSLESHRVAYRIKNAGIAFQGHFDSLQVQFSLLGNASDSVNARVTVSSLQTAYEAMTRHLMKSSFFDESNFPYMYMTCKQLTRRDGNVWQGKFALTIKGITRTYPLEFRFDPVSESNVVELSWIVRRKDFEIGSKSYPSLGRKVWISIKAQFIKS